MSTLAEIAASLPGCDPQALRVEQAQQILRRFIVPLQGNEAVPLRNALGRVLAEDVFSPIDVPAHDNSAMDGYALRGSDLSANAPIPLKIIGSALAGHSHHEAVAPGECVRIMTGAVMPIGCDTVVPQERIRSITESAIGIAPGTVKPGDNRRLRGEDLRAGTVALRAGKILRPADLGLLASLGIDQVSTKRKLRVAFFSTGDELRSLGEMLTPGCVYDSNRYTLHGMLTRLGCDTVDLGTVKDDPTALEAALRIACEQADAVITSGGASTGDADYIRQTASRLGDVAFWSMAMRPGRPFAFGSVTSQGNSVYLLGLPGNPVATMVAFHVLVRDALLQMMGAKPGPRLTVPAALEAPLSKRPGRAEYLRGIASHNASGLLQVRPTGAQGSGILRSMSEANCLIVLTHEQGDVPAGRPVDILLFDGLI